jgi:hypothetical protein
VRLLSFSVPERLSRTQRARSPARPGKRKLAMFPMARTVMQAGNPGRCGREKISCQRHARKGRFKKTNASGTNMYGPFSRPSVFQDCLRSTCRRRIATQARPMSSPTTADCRRNLRPKVPLHLLRLGLGRGLGVRCFFQKINGTMPRRFQGSPQVLAQYAEHHHLHSAQHEHDDNQR